jgi:hypothetical protein
MTDLWIGACKGFSTAGEVSGGIGLIYVGTPIAAAVGGYVAVDGLSRGVKELGGGPDVVGQGYEAAAGETGGPIVRASVGLVAAIVGWRAERVAKNAATLATKVAKAADNLATTPLARTVTGVADDALVHFGPEAYSVIKPGAGGQVFSFRYGDIKHLTPRQVETVIGDLAASGQRGWARVMHVLDVNPGAATRKPGAVVSTISEFVFDQPVPVSGGFIFK